MRSIIANKRGLSELISYVLLVVMVVAIAAGMEHTVALKSDGTVWEWGCDGTAIFDPTPKQVPGLTGALAIAAGGEHSLVLKEDGSIWAWGWNYYGQLGDGTRTYTFNQDSVVGPVQVRGLPPLISSPLLRNPARPGRFLFR